MSDPNAAAGVKKIRAGAVLELLSTLLMVGVGVAVDTFHVGAENTSADNTVLAAMGFALLGAAAFSLIALILQLVGSAQSGKDEPRFRYALIFILLAMAGTVAGTVLRENEPYATIAKDLTQVFNTFVRLFIVWGCIALARRMNRPKMARYGSKTAAIIIIVFVTGQCLAIFGERLLAASVAWTAALAVAGGVLAIVQVVLYLRCLKKAVRMLN